MTSKPQRRKGPDGPVSMLNIAMDALNLVKDICAVPPAQATFGFISALLTMVGARTLQSHDDDPRFHIYSGYYGDRQDYVELGLFRVDVYRALDRGLDGKRLDELSKPVLGPQGHQLGLPLPVAPRRPLSPRWFSAVLFDGWQVASYHHGPVCGSQSCRSLLTCILDHRFHFFHAISASFSMSIVRRL